MALNEASGSQNTDVKELLKTKKKNYICTFSCASIAHIHISISIAYNSHIYTLHARAISINNNQLLRGLVTFSAAAAACARVLLLETHDDDARPAHGEALSESQLDKDRALYSVVVVAVIKALCAS